MDIQRKIYTFALIAIATCVAVFSLLLMLNLVNPWSESSSDIAVRKKLQKDQDAFKNLHFELVDPAQAPEPIQKLVAAGYQIMLHTPLFAADYVGDRLSCTNCHFGGGDTMGGLNNGISLAGVGGKYPAYDERAGKVIDLPTRINSCFNRSMNGKPVPLDSEIMLSLVTYLQWISKNIPIYQKVPWLGLPSIKSTHVPNGENGGKIYAVQCALCHGENGIGEIHHDIPPVWGPKSFNDAAGMNNLSKLASFIHHNMPYDEPSLSEEDALDVADFIRHQVRPHYKE